MAAGAADVYAAVASCIAARSRAMTCGARVADPAERGVIMACTEAARACCWKGVYTGGGRSPVWERAAVPVLATPWQRQAACKPVQAAVGTGSA